MNVVLIKDFISSSANQTLSLLGLPNVGISVSAVVDGVRTFVFVSSGVGVNLIEVLGGATSSIRDIKNMVRRTRRNI